MAAAVCVCVVGADEKKAGWARIEAKALVKASSGDADPRHESGAAVILRCHCLDGSLKRGEGRIGSRPVKSAMLAEA